MLIKYYWLNFFFNNIKSLGIFLFIIITVNDCFCVLKERKKWNVLWNKKTFIFAEILGHWYFYFPLLHVYNFLSFPQKIKFLLFFLIIISVPQNNHSPINFQLFSFIPSPSHEGRNQVSHQSHNPNAPINSCSRWHPGSG